MPSIPVPQHTPDDAWVGVSLPDLHWYERWPDYQGWALYRVTFQADCFQERQLDDPLTLVISYLNAAGAVYVNGQLLHRDIALSEPLTQGVNTPRHWILTSLASRTDQLNTLHVYVKGVPQRIPAGLGSVVIAPYHEAMPTYNAWLWSKVRIPWMSIMVSCAFGLASLVVWLKNRQLKVFFWYGAVNLAWVLFYGVLQLQDPWPLPSTLAILQVSHIAFVFYVACFCMLLWRFAERQSPRLESSLWVCVAIASVVLLYVPSPSLRPVVDVVVLPLFVILLLSVFIQFITFTVSHPRTERVIVSVTLIFFVVIMLHDLSWVFVPTERGEPTIWAPYATLPAAICMALVMTFVSRRTIQLLTSFNTELESEIEVARQTLQKQMEDQQRLQIANSKLHERLRLGRELHDGLGSSLVSAIARMERHQGSLHHAKTYRIALATLKLLRNDLRHIIDNAFTSSQLASLEPGPWIAPIRQRYSTLFDELGMRLVWSVPARWQQPPSAERCMALARIMEEALTNIIKHSRAKTARITMRQNTQSLLLAIEDDGIGFDMSLVKEAGFSVGIQSMQVRAKEQSGHLWVHSHPGTTRIVVRTPSKGGRGGTSVR
ncbi:sensor histidine kinase [Vreelandella olivaria]|uniref:sensor histidine kinase n=1 Tax=Vreelandella olivaria TaxID=390919 RepID=UPI00201E8EB6